MTLLPPKNTASFAAEVYTLTALVPAGRVATYGLLATLLGSPRHARLVGHALAGLRSDNPRSVPWHRVINASGRISAPNDAHRHHIQQAMLEAEGVLFDASARCDLRRYLWRPQLDTL